MKGFIPYQYPDGQPTPWEYLPAAAGDYEVGAALGFSAGKLTLLTGGTAAPQYICMCDKTGNPDGGVLPVIRVAAGVVYASGLSVDAAGIQVGAKYTIDATGRMVTATETDGVAQVTAYDGKTAGSAVYVRF